MCLLAPGLLCPRVPVSGVTLQAGSTLSRSQQADKLEAGNIVKTYLDLDLGPSLQNTGHCWD